MDLSSQQTRQRQAELRSLGSSFNGMEGGERMSGTGDGGPITCGYLVPLQLAPIPVQLVPTDHTLWHAVCPHARVPPGDEMRANNKILSREKMGWL